MKIEVTNCLAVGSIFSNFTPGSQHEVVPTPKSFKNSKHGGVWVKGSHGKPVRLLVGEYKIIDHG